MEDSAPQPTSHIPRAPLRWMGDLGRESHCQAPLPSCLQSLKMQGREVEEMSAVGNALGDSVHQNEGTHAYVHTNIYKHACASKTHLHEQKHAGAVQKG